ncbi:uncharacterized protein [Temnothorax nylanderi]|uniref:uncharacterized protein n=1 Tax=Temnothorax nylanderi TaxID=102681 RepID=UPI003A8C49C3
MSKNSFEDLFDRADHLIHQINETQMKLKIRHEQVSRMRMDCAKLQLELMRLYRPQCLEILEMLQDVSVPVDPFDRNGDIVESRDNVQVVQGNEVLRTNEDVSRKSTT